MYCLGGSGWEGGYLSLAGRIGETLEIFYFHHNTTGVWPIYHSQESKASSFRHRCLISNWSISCFAYLSLHITLGCKRLAVFSVIYHLSLEVLGSIFSLRPLGPLFDFVLHTPLERSGRDSRNKQTNMQLKLLKSYNIQGVFLTGSPPKKLKYVKPRLGVSTLT